MWAPSDQRDDGCLSGRRVMYKRRKQDAACYIPDDFHASDGHWVLNCPCDYENYLCDYCFKREGQKCVYDSDTPACTPDLRNVSCQPGQTEVLQTQGYRKVPGDTCILELEGAKDLLPKVVSCGTLGIFPPESYGVGVGVAICFLLSVFLFGMGILWYLSGTNRTVRRIVASRIPIIFLPEDRTEAVASGPDNEEDIENQNEAKPGDPDVLSISTSDGELDSSS